MMILEWKIHSKKHPATTGGAFSAFTSSHVRCCEGFRMRYGVAYAEKEAILGTEEEQAPCQYSFECPLSSISPRISARKPNICVVTSRHTGVRNHLKPDDFGHRCVKFERVAVKPVSMNERVCFRFARAWEALFARHVVLARSVLRPKCVRPSSLNRSWSPGQDPVSEKVAEFARDASGV